MVVLLCGYPSSTNLHPQGQELSRALYLLLKLKTDLSTKLYPNELVKYQQPTKFGPSNLIDFTVCG